MQHFWSLAVEEQFYVVWPLLIIVLLHWQRRSQAPLRRTLLLGLLAVAIPSLLWSVWLTAEKPGAAYFVTTTRLWELAVGGLLVFAVSRCATWAPSTRAVVGWGGLAAIGYAAVTYDASTTFPGLFALVPTLGAAAVIAAGVEGRAPGLDRVLGAPVMQDVGAGSYSLYLWHWPVVVAATALWGAEDELALPVALVAVAFSAVPAWLAYRFVEKPVHEARSLAAPRRAFPGGCCAWWWRQGGRGAARQPGPGH